MESFTPDLAASLNGITRKSIISLAKEDGIEVKVKISLNEILDADELFYRYHCRSSSYQDGGSEFNRQWERGPITTILQKVF